MQVSLPERMWLHFEEGDHVGFTFTNNAAVTFLAAPNADNYCHAAVGHSLVKPRDLVLSREMCLMFVIGCL